MGTISEELAALGLDETKWLEASIPRRLAMLLELRGLSQAELARRASMSRSSLNKTINNKREPTSDDLVRLSEALGIRFDVLCQGEASGAIELDDSTKELADVLRKLIASEDRAQNAERTRKLLETKIETQIKEHAARIQQLEEAHDKELRRLKDRHSGEVADLRKSEQDIRKERDAIRLQLTLVNVRSERLEHDKRQLEERISQWEYAYSQLMAQAQQARRGQIVAAGLGALVSGGLGALFGTLAGDRSSKRRALSTANDYDYDYDDDD